MNIKFIKSLTQGKVRLHQNFGEHNFLLALVQLHLTQHTFLHAMVFQVIEKLLPLIYRIDVDHLHDFFNIYLILTQLPPNILNKSAHTLVQYKLQRYILLVKPYFLHMIRAYEGTFQLDTSNDIALVLQSLHHVLSEWVNGSLCK